MNKFTQLILLLLCSLLLTQCDWLFGKKDPEPQLPPATQEGKNTFGCLMNGKVWVPEGRRGIFGANLKVNVDPSFRGGHVLINVYRYIEGKVDQSMAISVDSVPKYGVATYPLLCIIDGPYTNGGAASFTNYLIQCDYFCRDKATLSNAYCTITKYDLNKAIVSGTFEFTLAKPGCDTIRVTDGRFDLSMY